MNSVTNTVKRKRGHQLLTDEKLKLTQDLVEVLQEGFYTDSALARKLNINQSTVKRYRPAAEGIIRSVKLDRSAIRNLQLQRSFKLVEGLVHDLEQAESTKEKRLIHSSIIKYFQHIGAIAGITTDSRVEITENRQLVIIRPSPTKTVQTV
jgi:hypothetical protein